MIHLAIILPDWNSLESVRRAHSDLEAAALVFFALLVLFDVLAHFSEDKKKEKVLDKIGLCFFAIAVLAEIAAYPYGQRNDALSEQVIGSLDTKVRQATSNASIALADSLTARVQAKDALAKAGVAQDSLAKTEDKANKAQAAGSNALSVARSAWQEADSFEKDIVSAKKQAADAESHLADALQRVADATEKLNQLKTPRSLGHVPELVSSLRAFSGTEYTFAGMFGDEEASKLLLEIDDVLQRAGWKRAKPKHSFPMLNMSIKGEKIEVPESMAVGLHLFADSKEADIDNLPQNKWSPLLKAAAALDVGLFASVFPPQEGDQRVQVEMGDSTVVRIIVGRKP